MRFRYIFMMAGSLLALAALFLTDPLDGAMTISWIVNGSRIFLGVAAMFFGYRAVTDYKEADGKSLHETAGKTSTGAGLALIHRGLVFIAVAIIISAFAGNASAQSVRTFIPEKARDHLPTLAKLTADKWPQLDTPWLLAGQIEKESCIRLTHSRCWSATSRLKSSREEGAGLGQITRTWRADGSQRFDALAELKAKHPELAEWSWSNVYQRPDLQLLAIVLKNRDNWALFTKTKEPEYFWLTAYNRGVGGVKAEMRACQIKAGCDPLKWRDNVETTCTASRRPLYAGKSACDISRAYAPGVMTRAPKYRGFFVGCKPIEVLT